MGPKSIKSRLFGLDRGLAEHDRVFAVGTNAKKWCAGHSEVYSLVTGQAKWKSRLIGIESRRVFDCAHDSRTGRNRPAFRPRMQRWPCIPLKKHQI